MENKENSDPKDSLQQKAELIVGFAELEDRIMQTSTVKEDPKSAKALLKKMEDNIFGRTFFGDNSEYWDPE